MQGGEYRKCKYKSLKELSECRDISRIYGINSRKHPINGGHRKYEQNKRKFKNKKNLLFKLVSVTAFSRPGLRVPWP